LQQTADESGRIGREQIKDLADTNHPTDMQAFYAALNWVIGRCFKLGYRRYEIHFSSGCE
jgi:hypothetical protein